jgi:hypothetical protein
MALQSSGQIKLSEIAAEFGGSAPHSLSEYHDKGNAPASGEIQLAADFYGTSNNISLNTTITCGEQTLKVNIHNRGFISSNGRTVGTTQDNANGTTSTIGSIANNNISGGGVVYSVYETNSPLHACRFKFEMSTGANNWTSLTVHNTTITRLSMAAADNNKLYTITLGGNGHSIIPASGSITFRINA